MRFLLSLLKKEFINFLVCFMKNRFLFGLVVLAAQLEKNKSGAKILPIDDPDRTYSCQDKEAGQYIKKIDGSFDDFPAAITKYNLEALEYLQKKAGSHNYYCQK